MKRIFKKVMTVCACVALSASMLMTSTVAQAATTGYFNKYDTIVQAVADRSGCTITQGIAVGSKWLYTVKINSNDTKAVISKTNKSTGATTNLKTSSGATTFNYLGHANDMDVATVNGKSNLYIATMKVGAGGLVRMEVDGSTITKKGSYKIRYNGADASVSAVSVESKTSSKINFLFKKGKTVYRGSIGLNATSGTINLTKVCTLNVKSVKINGTTTDLSKFTPQGMGYHKGKLYVPLWAGGAGKNNQSVIAVYNINSNTTGTVTSDPNLSFRITSGSYNFFEIESCDISTGDGRLYFCTNRNLSRDGLHAFKSYAVKV